MIFHFLLAIPPLFHHDFFMYCHPSTLSAYLDDRILTPVLASALPLDFVVRHGVRLAFKGVQAAKSRIDRAIYLRQANETAAKTATPSPSDVAEAWQIPRSPAPPPPLCSSATSSSPSKPPLPPSTPSTKTAGATSPPAAAASRNG